MESYIKTWYRSRGIDIGEEPIPCERCLHELLNGISKGVNVGDDIHHVCPGAKMRKYKKDGSDLLLLCRYHHTSQHDSNGRKNVEKCLEIAKEISNIYNTLKHKEKIRALVTYFNDHDKINRLYKRKSKYIQTDEGTIS